MKRAGRTVDEDGSTVTRPRGGGKSVHKAGTFSRSDPTDPIPTPGA